MGSEVAALEKQLSTFTGSSHVVQAAPAFHMR